MKKIISLILALITVLSFAGCGSEKSDAPEAKTSQTPDESQSAVQSDNQSIDVDLTALSSTMVYSEVYNMMTMPVDYLGKTVKMKGKFTIYPATDENGEVDPDYRYYACVIADATACCSQGLEFVLKDERKYPEEYPEPGDEITVIGEFQTYFEGADKFCHLINAELL